VDLAIAELFRVSKRRKAGTRCAQSQLAGGSVRT
jgi:hypothetical protein